VLITLEVTKSAVQPARSTLPASVPTAPSALKPIDARRDFASAQKCGSVTMNRAAYPLRR
jgi:hypothetical protein